VDVLAERLELDRVPADADAQAQPSPREDVDRGRLLGDEGRLTLGQDENAGGQLDAPRDRGAEREEGEGLVEGVPVVVLAVPTPVASSMRRVIAAQNAKRAKGSWKACR